MRFCQSISFHETEEICSEKTAVISQYLMHRVQKKKEIQFINCVEEDEEEKGQGERNINQEDTGVQPYVSLSSICCHLFHGRIKKHGFSAMTFKIVTRRSDKSHWTDFKADRIHVAAEMYQHIHVEHKVVVFIEETHWTICKQNCGHSPK